ncbi:hypothetical protein [Streptomyces capitiformicae]|uniref:Uncharacterized protein n=1 Tax=Streptomyces capitiformicae TaxID=2014920 RepID=A0A919GM47_9ACTN|nr:hypothetical protein [Streptomyces capitiformicae]GHH87092.1 hypothetical protein GCM10017771_26870 [Streptomyces capitiformicae]
MSFEEQWSSARNQATTNSTTSAAADSGQGEAGGRMVYIDFPWLKGARVLTELRATTASGVTQLSDEDSTFSPSTKALATVLAMDAVRDSWHRRLKAVRDECENLDSPMRQVARDQGENEAALTSAIASERMSASRFPGGK